MQQVDQSDWPVLSFFSASVGEGEVLRVFEAPHHPRYATSFHFWVHALRDELAARGRRVDLVGAAGHGLGRLQSEPPWQNEIAPVRDRLAFRQVKTIHRMLESECRRSSVAETDRGWLAHFWGHGEERSWHQWARS